MYIALRGQRFDGHDFIADAVSNGASAALVDRDIPDSFGIPLLRVEDTRKAMGRLAAVIRQNFSGKVIAVAGSNGKTSTKNLIDSTLRVARTGSMSPKSFNNDVGVPLAIFPAESSDDYLVLELGTNHPGEIANLSAISQPDIAVITNCSAEHLEGLGDLAGVRRENACIIEHLKADGTLIVNGDDPELLAATAGFTGKRITFGFSPYNDLFPIDIRCDARGTRFYLNGWRTLVRVPMLGRHAACNALAAVAVGHEMGLTDEQILEGLASSASAEMRLQMQCADGVDILNDAYNANPASMLAALHTLGLLPAAGRRVAVLGDMRELGEWAADCHREIGQAIAREGRVDLLLCVGSLAELIGQAAIETGYPAASVRNYTNAAAACEISGELQSGDVLLVKGSRAIGLEAVARAAIAARSSRKAAS